MTESNSASKNIKTADRAQVKRNKTTDADGRRYDQRRGLWSHLDESAVREAEILHGWLTIERCDAELRLLNHPGKRGRRFEYPPSLILFILLLTVSDSKSYRRGAADQKRLLDLLGLPAPTYSTLHKAEAAYFSDDSGQVVMSAATEMLRAEGTEEMYDPAALFFSGKCPEFTAPHKIPLCQADVDRQKAMDEEAGRLSGSMCVIVMNSSIGAENVTVAADGSGVGISGPGTYMEHVWKISHRHFLKIHVLLDVADRSAVAFAVTMESTADSVMLIPLVEAAVEAGVGIDTVLADAAYDSKANWTAMGSMGIEFIPNLRTRFGKNHELDDRNAMLDRENEVGKKALHKENGYNMRWLIEAFFSQLKKLFGSSVRNRLFGRMSVTIRHRFRLFDIRCQAKNEIFGTVGA